MTRLKIAFAVSASVLALGSTGSATAYTGENLAKDAKIGMERAVAIAQRVRPGKMTDKELEREKGGSGLRYSFDIESAHRTYEVGVDAMTGKVIENSVEANNPD